MYVHNKIVSFLVCVVMVTSLYQNERFSFFMGKRLPRRYFWDSLLSLPSGDVGFERDCWR